MAKRKAKAEEKRDPVKEAFNEVRASVGPLSKSDEAYLQKHELRVEDLAAQRKDNKRDEELFDMFRKGWEACASYAAMGANP